MATIDRPLEHPRRPALLAGVAGVTGCALGVLAGVPPGAAWWLLAAGMAVGIGALFFARGASAWGTGAAVFLSVGLLFAGYTAVILSSAPGTLAQTFPEGAELARIEGVVIEGGDYVKRDPAAFEFPEAPESGDDFPVGRDPRRSVSWLIEVDRLPDVDQSARGQIKLYAPGDVELELHSRVRVVGKLRRPRRAGNPGELDSRQRYERRGVTHTLAINDAGQVTVIDPPSPWDPRRLAPWVHEQFHRHIGARMSRDRAAILGATLLGERGNLTPDQRAKFVRSGTVHLLVVSGLHVGLLAGAVLLVLRALGLSRSAWAVAGIVCVLYLFVTGIQPSVLRATTMVVIYALGKVLVRRPDPLNVLGASALLALIVNPLDVAELGFQLSYLAVLGIFVVAPALRLRRRLSDSERAVRRWYEHAGDWVGASLRISLAVGLATWPLLAYTVHVVAPAMFVTNLVVGPLLTLMLGVAVFAPLSVIPGLGAPIAWVLSQLAGVLDLLATTFADVPGGHLFLASPPVWWLAGYYALLFLAIRAPRWHLPAVAGAGAWLLWLSLLPAGGLLSSDTPGPATVTALDVGQGQCVVIEVPNGPCAVLDCGSTSLGGAGERVLAPYLWSRGRGRIDVLFISHADADHVNGLPQVFERFDVGRVYVSEVFDDDATGARLLAWLRERAEVRRLRRGDTVKLADGLNVRCLGPAPGFVTGLLPERERRNEGSLVLQLAAGPTHILLPSDAETAGLAPALSGRDETADVLFAPHQGSRVEGLPALLEKLRPRHVVVSARETFPAQDSMHAYEESGAEVWKTWQHGAVSLKVGADGRVEVTPWLSGPDQ